MIYCLPVTLFHGYPNKGKLRKLAIEAGLDVVTCGVANAASFYLVVTKFSRLVANLAPKIGDFLLWENVH